MKHVSTRVVHTFLEEDAGRTFTVEFDGRWYNGSLCDGWISALYGDYLIKRIDLTNCDGTQGQDPGYALDLVNHFRRQILGPPLTMDEELAEILKDPKERAELVQAIVRSFAASKHLRREGNG